MGSWKKDWQIPLFKNIKTKRAYPEKCGSYLLDDYRYYVGDREGMAQLYLLGVEPVWLSNGKVKHFKIIALNDLGRPRIDITVKISGILRDNFSELCLFFR